MNVLPGVIVLLLVLGSQSVSALTIVLPEEGWAGLTDYRVGMVRGMKHAEWGLRDIESVVTVNVTEQLFGMLEYGRIDIAVTSRVSGLYFIKEYDLQPLYVVKPASC